MTDSHHNWLVWFALVLVFLSCAFGAERPHIYREPNGDLHINPGDNQTVYIGGVDTVSRIEAQDAEIAHLHNLTDMLLDRVNNLSAVLESLQYELHIMRTPPVPSERPTTSPTATPTYSSSERFKNDFHSDVDGCDLSKFSGIKAMDGNLTIARCHSMSDVESMSDLEIIRGNLRIHDNRGLQSLNGFSKLKSIGGYLHIMSNDNMQSIGGFEELLSVGGHITICGNGRLGSIPDKFYELSASKSGERQCLMNAGEDVCCW